MGAVTVNSRTKGELTGGRSRLLAANVSAAATGDTFITGFKKIYAVSADPPSTTSVGAGTSGGTVTFNYSGGGAMANIQIIVIGI